MKLTFSNPCAFDATVFGASFGFAGAMDPNLGLRRTFAPDLDGVLLTGTFAEILAGVPGGGFQAGVVLLGNCGGEDAFVSALAKKAGCGLTGGSAAINPKTGEKGLILGRGQAAVYLIRDERYDVSVESRNIHTRVLEQCCVTFTDPRWPETICGEDALSWYCRKRRELGIGETDFEHMTLSDLLGVNAHFSVVNGRLMAGRDLESTMLLRVAPEETVLSQMQEFYDDPTALICGCAGLKGILPQPIVSPGTGLFLFGEVATLAGESRFGNLMLSKLCVKER